MITKILFSLFYFCIIFFAVKYDIAWGHGHVNFFSIQFHPVNTITLNSYTTEILMLLIKLHSIQLKKHIFWQLATEFLPKKKSYHSDARILVDLLIWGNTCFTFAKLVRIQFLFLFYLNFFIQMKAKKSHTLLALGQIWMIIKNDNLFHSYMYYTQNNAKYRSEIKTPLTVVLHI